MFSHSLEHPEKLIQQDVGKKSILDSQSFQTKHEFSNVTVTFPRFRTICVISGQNYFLHIFVHGVYMKLNNIFFLALKLFT